MKFKAVDGAEFNDEKECLKYEALIKEVNTIMSVLKPKPINNNSNFTNGGGFLQHDKIILSKVKFSLLHLIKKYIDHKWVQETIDNENVHPSYIGRLLDDYGIRPLSEAWYRFNCKDKNCKEWGQPYFADNPTKGTQIAL